MKTKKIPYKCPICDGTGLDPKQSGKDTVLLCPGDIIEADDERLNCYFDWEKVQLWAPSFIGTKVVGSEVGKYQRPFKAVKCSVCKGEKIVWGTETDDSFDFGKVTVNPDPYVPHPYVPYPRSPLPYVGDYPYNPGIPWYGTISSNKITF